MKSQSVLQVALCLLLIGLLPGPTLFSQNYDILRIGNVTDNAAKAKPGDIIRISIQKGDFQKLVGRDVFLYMDGRKSNIKAFAKQAADQQLYFLLAEEAMGQLLETNAGIVKMDSLSMGFGFDTGLQSNYFNVHIEWDRTPANILADSKKIGLRDKIFIHVPDKSRFTELNRRNKSAPLMLYLKYIRMDSSQLVGIDYDQQILTFVLNADEVIHNFYDTEKQGRFPLGIGTQDQTLVSTTDQLTIEFFEKRDRLISWGIILGILVLLLALSAFTDLIRDTGVYGPDEYRPFSFARTQLAYWSFIIISSFIFIWFTTKGLAFFPNSALILLGISVTVTVAGRAIDTRISTAQMQELKPFRQKNHIKGLIFFQDILSDGGGLSIHRFQYFAFNVFLGFVFIWNVYKSLEMPSFSTELLSLMGVSAAAYAGVKGFETSSLNRTSQTATRTGIHKGDDAGTTPVVG